MNFLTKLKKFAADKKAGSENQDIYQGLGELEVYTLLADKQLSVFVAEIANNPNLTETEKNAFQQLWYAACIDMDGRGNNIWNLKEGAFTMTNENDTTLAYEKKCTGIDRYSDQGRANFVYKSKEGNVVLNQHERNSKAFLVFVSNLSERFKTILDKAERDALKLRDPAMQIAQIKGKKGKENQR